jgi:hypothetical protein
MILDLSFAARFRRTTGRGPRGKTSNRGQKRHGVDIIQASVNDNTRRLAPDVVLVKELGNVLPRLLDDFIATVPADENTSTSRSWISPTDTGE